MAQENMVSCNTNYDYDHDSDHIPIFSEWNLQVQEKAEDYRLQFKNTDLRKLCDNLTKSLYYFPHTPALDPNELNNQVELLVKIIEEAMIMSTPKERLCARSIPDLMNSAKRHKCKLFGLKKYLIGTPQRKTGRSTEWREHLREDSSTKKNGIAITSTVKKHVIFL